MVKYKSLSFLVDSEYRVGDDGSVWSRKYGSWRRLKPAPVDEWGHLSQPLQRNGKGVSFLVHHLVLMAFIGPRPSKQQCRHLNGRGWDNRLHNLCWGTPAEDAEDKRRHGTLLTGSQIAGAKMTAGKVKQLCLLWLTGCYLIKGLALKFNVTEGNVRAILYGRSWLTVTNSIGFKHPKPGQIGGDHCSKVFRNGRH